MNSCYIVPYDSVYVSNRNRHIIVDPFTSLIVSTKMSTTCSQDALTASPSRSAKRKAKMAWDDDWSRSNDKKSCLTPATDEQASEDIAGIPSSDQIFDAIWRESARDATRKVRKENDKRVAKIRSMHNHASSVAHLMIKQLRESLLQQDVRHVKTIEHVRQAAIEAHADLINEHEADLKHVEAKMLQGQKDALVDHQNELAHGIAKAIRRVKQESDQKQKQRDHELSQSKHEFELTLTNLEAENARISGLLRVKSAWAAVRNDISAANK
jgi:hypothetical protein